MSDADGNFQIMNADLSLAIRNTLLVSLGCLAVAIPVGGLLAILIVRTNAWGRRWAWIAVSSQLAVPLYVFAGGWSAGLGLQGWLSPVFAPLASLALQAGAWSLLAVSLIHAAAAIPWVCLILSLGLLFTHRGQEEAARIDGGDGHVLRKIILPKLKIWIAAASAWCALPVLTEMVVTNLYQVPTVAEQVYVDASRGGALKLYTYVSAGLLCMLPLAIAGGWLWYRGPAWRRVIASLAHHPARPITLRGRGRLAVTCLAWLSVASLVGVPILNLIIKAGWQPYVTADSIGHQATHYAWSPSRFLTTVYEALYLFQAEFYWSGLLALASTAVAGLLAISLTWLAALWPPLRWMVNAVMLVLICVPGPLVGLMVIQLLNRSQPAWLGQLYDTTLAAPVLAQQFRLLPMGWLLLSTMLAGISTRTWEQAAVDGVRGWSLFQRVLMPQLWRQAFAVALLLAVTSVGELSCTILVLPPGVTTVSMRLFELLHFGMRHQDSGLCGALILLGWCVSLAVWKTLSER